MIVARYALRAQALLLYHDYWPRHSGVLHQTRCRLFTKLLLPVLINSDKLLGHFRRRSTGSRRLQLVSGRGQLHGDRRDEGAGATRRFLNPLELLLKAFVLSIALLVHMRSTSFVEVNQVEVISNRYLPLPLLFLLILLEARVSI
jgi:hypothetical protein